MTRKSLLLSLALLCVSTSLFAGSLKISGVVRDSNGRGVKGVKVTDGRKFVKTDYDGCYVLEAHDDAQFVYISIPRGFETPVRNSAPLFYKELDRSASEMVADFDLIRTGIDEKKHQFFVWADVQVYNEEEIDLVRQAAADARAIAEDKDIPAFGMSCGDIMGEWTGGMSTSIHAATAEAGFPFFTLMGNHDYRSDRYTNEDCKLEYQKLYGPTYYSFDKGDIHYIVMDDVFYYYRHYIGYIEKSQLEWMKADLADVPEGKTVVLFSHIPTYSYKAGRGEWSKEQQNNIVCNRSALYEILKPYKAHICSAHKHYGENYEISANLMEHNHAPLSGLFWQSLLSADGTPWGYYVYEVDGNDISWYFKAVGQPREIQMSCYKVGEDPRKRDCIVANVWNWDPKWKVEWFENGEPKGEMERYTGWDRAIVDDVENRRDKEFTWRYIGAGPTEHLFCARPSSPDSRVEVVVTDRFGNVYRQDLTHRMYELESEAPKAQKHPEYGVFCGADKMETALYDQAVAEMVLDKEADGTFRTGELWSGVWTRDVSYSAILSLAHLEPEVVKTSLMKKVDRKSRIIQDTGTGGSWPCSSDREIWAAAAWEVYLATGDIKWVREVFFIIRRSLEADLVSVYNPQTGLFRGESSFIDWREQSYPTWMQPADIAQSECLGTNAVFYRALDVTAKMAALLGRTSDQQKYEKLASDLRDAINAAFWMEEEGYYGNFIYGREGRVLSRRSETLGESLCILWDIASPEQARSIIDNMPVCEYGPTIFSPQISAIKTPYHNNGIWPFVTSFYGMAAAKTGNRAALQHALNSNARAAALFSSNMENMVASDGSKNTALNSPRQLWSVAGYIGLYHNALLGLNYTPEGIRFAPVVPASMKGLRVIEGLEYRDMKLTVSVSGEGTVIRHFRLDGVECEPFVSASLTGEHLVEIDMRSEWYAEPDRLKVEPVVWDLDFPVSCYDGQKISWDAVAGADRYKVLSGGEVVATVRENFFETARSGEYSVVAVKADGVESFMGEPLRISPDEQVIEVSAMITNKRGSQMKKAVETGPEGVYYIDFEYSNGNGDISTFNKCATRSLYVDGQRVGVVVMPQRGDDWGNRGWTAPVEVKLGAGKHNVELRLLEENINMNIDIDNAIVHNVRLTRKN